jgi:hypothetical protein
MFKRHLYLLALAVWPGIGLLAQETVALDPLTAPAPIVLGVQDNQSTVQSLEALQRALAVQEEELASLQVQLQSATDDMARDEIRTRIISLRKEIDDQRRQFERFAVDIDLTPFSPHTESTFDWQKEVGKLLEPIMAEIESATAESRVIGQLRAQIDDVGEKRDLAEKAVANLEALLKQPASDDLTARLNSRLDAWKRILDQASNEYTALDLQLQSRLAVRKSMLEQTTGYARHFFRTKGLNLFLGVTAFCVVFFGFRVAEYLLRRMRQEKGKKSFSSRLTALLFHLFSVLGGLLAMLAVFNLVGDWFLLGIVVIFLFGVAWAGINTLPQQVETIKLMLNIGAVREDERLEFEGMPYHVDSLGFSAVLSNPLLDGSHRIVPVKSLVGLHSRRAGEHEPWFPCRRDDWVELADGKIGRVFSQSPASVQLIEIGGSRTTYLATTFLEHNPKNLSTGTHIESVFGIDYRHQSIATTDVPRVLREKISAGLSLIVSKEHIRDIQVNLRAASASSLDYCIAVDLRGEAAEHGRAIRFALARIFVETCNEQGWLIPFPQITVHQPKAL